MFERFDEVLSERIGEGSIDNDQFSTLMDTLAHHNQICPAGQEVSLQLVCIAGESFIQENLVFLDKSQLLSSVGGYCTSGVMKQLPELQQSFESELKSRMHALTSGELVYILRMFS